MTNEKGFMLPYILLIILLTFVCLSASVHIYNNEINLTQSHIDRLKIETLIQMAYTEFKDDFSQFELEREEVYYRYPDGHVTITYTIFNESLANLYFYVETESNAVYTVTKLINL